MDPKYREDIATRKRGNAAYKAGVFTTTGTTAATIWTPATGRVLRVYRIKMQAYVTTALNTGTALEYLYVYDNVITAPLTPFLIQNTGSATATRVAQLGQIVTTTDAATVHYGYCDIDFGTSGLRLTAANNVLKAGVTSTIGTGVIAFQGVVIGIEEDA